MDRRHFMGTSVGTAAALASASPFALTSPAQPPSAFDAFAAQRAAKPWTAGYVGVQADVEPMRLTLHGKVPRGLRGRLFRNGPARHALGGERYHHLFDGDGMVQRYDVTDSGIVHRGRFVQTDKFVAETAAGRHLRMTFGTRPTGAESPPSADSLNVANTSIIQHAGELLALWEGGSATRIDPSTLATQGTRTWSDDLAGMPFSAHPKVDTDGTLWNFGITNARDLLTVYRIDRTGRLVQSATLPVPDLAMVHDFAITRSHLVFLLPPLVFELDRLKGGATFIDSHVWKPELGMRVLVLPKDRLDAPQWLTLPAGFVFHVGNAWEDEAGTIRLDCMRADTAWQATTGLKDVMRGNYQAKDLAHATLIELHPKTGRAQQTVLPHIAEFPVIDPRRVGQRHHHLYTALRLQPGDRPGHDAVMRLDVDTGRTTHYRYGADVLVEEHLFVPRRPGGPEGDGWLIGTAIDVRHGQMLLSVFDAQHLSDGPLAQGRMDRIMPFGFHGTFMKEG